MLQANGNWRGPVDISVKHKMVRGPADLICAGVVSLFVSLLGHYQNRLSLRSSSVKKTEKRLTTSLSPSHVYKKHAHAFKGTRWATWRALSNTEFDWQVVFERVSRGERGAAVGTRDVRRRIRKHSTNNGDTNMHTEARCSAWTLITIGRNTGWI